MNIAQAFRAFAFLEREYPTDETLSDRIDRAKTYVDSRLYRAEVVTTLPLSAPGGYLMVKAGDTNLYVGAGTGNPLRRIPTQAVP